MTDKMTIDADTVRNICSNLHSMIELLDPGAPVAEVAEDPPEDLQGPSVVDRGSYEIKQRWAKETIGLAAIELNQAYAEFEITNDGCSIPSGPLHSAAERLQEAMRRLGLDFERDPLPF